MNGCLEKRQDKEQEKRRGESLSLTPQTAQNGDKTGAGQAVVDILAALLGAHDPAVAQDGKVIGNGGEVHPRPAIGMQHTHALLTLRKPFHQTQTHGAPERLENGRELLRAAPGHRLPGLAGRFRICAGTCTHGSVIDGGDYIELWPNVKTFFAGLPVFFTFFSSRNIRKHKKT